MVDMRIEMHEVDSWEKMCNPGDYMVANSDYTVDKNKIVNGSKRRFPIIVCPGCLKPCSCSLHTLVQEKPLSITASFLCNQKRSDGSGQVCGWHGRVTNGFMESC